MKTDYTNAVKKYHGKSVNQRTKLRVICPNGHEYEQSIAEHYNFLKAKKNPCAFCRGRVPHNYWTKERCVEDAKKYKTRSDWKINSSAYSIARRNGWLEECYTNMPRQIKSIGYWTKKRCIEDAKKYKTKLEWLKNSGSAIVIARRNGWIEICTNHMIKRTANHFWTKEKCIRDAKKYKTTTEWRTKSLPAWTYAYLNNFSQECYKFLKNGRKKPRKWTKEMCIGDAKKYKTYKEWIKNSTGSCDSARRNGWLEECRKHMLICKRNFWTKKTCKEDALKYKTRTEWYDAKGSGAMIASQNGWIDECCKHMKRLIKPNGYWTLKKCIINAMDYKISKKWRKNSGGAWNAAYINGWLPQCTKHMKRPSL